MPIALANRCVQHALYDGPVVSFSFRCKGRLRLSICSANNAHFALQSTLFGVNLFRQMPAFKICAFLVIAILLECADAHDHGDTELDKIPVAVAAQRYPSLTSADIEPGFLAAYRRKLTAEKQDEDIVQTCEPKCVKSTDGHFLSCDDLVCILYAAVFC